MPGVTEGLQLLLGAARQEADEVQAVQLELQGAVELEQALSVGDGPSGKKGSCWGRRCGLVERGLRGGLQMPEWGP